MAEVLEGGGVIPPFPLGGLEIHAMKTCTVCGKAYAGSLYVGCPFCKVRELRQAIVDDTLRMARGDNRGVKHIEGTRQ